MDNAGWISPTGIHSYITEATQLLRGVVKLAA